MEASEKGYNKLMEAINTLSKLDAGNSSGFDVKAWAEKCYDALNDDFNTPILIAELFSAVKFINQVKPSLIRVEADEELRGLDIGEHGMEAYPGFQIFTTQ